VSRWKNRITGLCVVINCLFLVYDAWWAARPAAVVLAALAGAGIVGGVYTLATRRRR
jgi:hypothetical protein